MTTTKSRKSNSKKTSPASKKLKLALYEGMLRPRMIEEKMLSLLRQGKISKWFSGIGQEAIAVGTSLALETDEWIFPMHRNLGVFTSRQIELNRLFAQWQGKPSGFTKGRDRSFHFGSKQHHIWGMISHLGPQLSIASGIGLAHKLSGDNKVAVAFTGEGGTSEGEFHEALNVAAVWQLPVIFIVENNGYGLSTPVKEQFRCKHIADKGIGYGMEAHRIDGNNIIEVYQTVSKLAKKIRKNPQPILLECETFRMRGHEEASGVKYVPKSLLSAWAKKDPVNNFEKQLLNEKIIDNTYIEELKDAIKLEINSHLKMAADSEELTISSDIEISDVFASHEHDTITSDGTEKEMRFIDAISNGLDLAMQKHGNLVLMGQDIADYGGVFKITEGFIEKYGNERVRNTPLCESAIIGIALGLSMMGYKSMVEMQFADFVTCGFNQIVNNLAKIHYRWAVNADVVIRMPCGGGVGAGPFHSQTNEAWFTHTPGLKIVYPSNPQDAKGLLLSAFEDPNPVLFFEHKGLYRSEISSVPDSYYNIEIGKGAYARRGSSLSIITYGMGVHWAVRLADEKSLDADIVDLRSLQPLDYDIIKESVMNTSRVIILHEDSLFGGLGGEISAYISEHLFEYLDAPVIRVGSLDTPIPFAHELENQYMADSRLEEAINKLLNY